MKMRTRMEMKKKRRRRVIEMDVMWMRTEEAEEAYVEEDVQRRGPSLTFSFTMTETLCEATEHLQNSHCDSSLASSLSARSWRPR